MMPGFSHSTSSAKALGRAQSMPPIPSALPRQIPDEVAGEMMLALLEGAILVHNIRNNVQNTFAATIANMTCSIPVSGCADCWHGASSDSVYSAPLKNASIAPLSFLQ